MDFNTPAMFQPDTQEPMDPPLTLRTDVELRALLLLPTRADIEALVNKLEASHRKELTALRKDMKSLTERMGSGESSVVAIEQQLSAVEATQTAQTTAILNQQLHLKEIEDRSRWNNLWLRGLPEATETKDLAATTLAIF